MLRQLSPYEKNFLSKHHFDLNSEELKTDIPIEYLLGKAEFRGLDFYVTQDTLIPRIETEQLVDLAIENIIKNYSSKHLSVSQQEKIIIIDLCTGSGCIGISLALELIKKNYNFHLYFLDVSKEALRVAKKNYLHFLPKYLSNSTFIQSDIFDKFPKNITADLVLSNPPYIPTQRIKTLDNSVKNYEPHVALDGGIDGLSLINKIIDQLPKIQNNKVNALIEIDEEHKIKNIKKSEGFNPSLIKDSFGKNRFLSLHSF
jgi:release factor glutamine methyltransferase